MSRDSRRRCKREVKRNCGVLAAAAILQMVLMERAVAFVPSGIPLASLPWTSSSRIQRHCRDGPFQQKENLSDAKSGEWLLSRSSRHLLKATGQPGEAEGESIDLHEAESSGISKAKQHSDASNNIVNGGTVWRSEADTVITYLLETPMESWHPDVLTK
jgi:hypothetical protein